MLYFNRMIPKAMGLLVFLWCAGVSVQSQTLDKARVYDMARTAFQNKLKRLPSAAAHSGGQSSVSFRNAEGNLSNTEESESEIHAAVNPTDSNNLIVAAMRLETSGLTGNLFFPIYYTTDFGETWNLNAFDGISDVSGQLVLGGGDPILVFDSEGAAYLSWLTFTADLSFEVNITLHWAVSEDGGATWTRTETLIDQGEVDGLLNPTGRFVDKQWVAVDRSESVYHDNIYAAYAEINFTDTTYNILVKTKAAGAESFGPAVDVTPEDQIFAQFASIDVGSDGQVHVLYAGGKATDTVLGLYHTRSADGGQTFSEPVRISDFHMPCFPPGAGGPCDIVGIDSARVYPCPHLRVDRSGGNYDGNLYAVWTADGFEGDLGQGLDVYYTRSEDDGQTWSEPFVLNNDGLAENDQFFPSIDVAETGQLVITWYDRRDDPANLLTNYYMTHSIDGGETFVDDFAVSSQAADFSMIGEGNGGFGVGEYTQVVTTSAFALPFWADGRTNDGNVEVFTTKIPLTDDVVLDAGAVSTISDRFSVNGPAPNPAREAALVDIRLKANSTVTLTLYDLGGEPVRQIAPATLAAGEHRLTVDLRELPAGIYTLVVRTGFGLTARKLTVIR